MSPARNVAHLVGERSGRRQIHVVVAAIVVSGLIRSLGIFRSFYWQDDYIHIWRAWNFPARDLILGTWNGHFEPASMAYFWLITRLAPQMWLPAAFYLSLLAFALPVAFWSLVVRLGGINRWTTAAGVIFAFWPGLLVVQTWLSAGLQLTWLLAALVCAHLLASRRPLWTVGAVLIGGCLFSERALFTLPLAFTAFVLFEPQGSLHQRIRGVWRARAHEWKWLLLLTGVLAMMFGLITRPLAQSVGTGTAPPWAEIWRGPLQGTFRGLLALPSDWHERGTFPVQIASWQTVVTTALVVMLSLLALRRNREQAMVTLVAVGLWVLAEPFLVMLTRSEFLNTGSLLLLADSRFSVAAGLSVLLGVAAWPGNKSVDRNSNSGLICSLSSAAVVTLALLELVAIVRMTDGAASRHWLSEARVSFLGDNSPALVSTASPGFMLNSFFLATDEKGNQYEQGTTRTLLAVGDEQPVFGKPTDLPAGADNFGKPSLVKVFPVRSETPTGFGENCSVRVDDEWLYVGMPATGLGNPVLSIDVLSFASSTAEVRIGEWRQSLRVTPGLRSLYFFPEPGAFEGFEIRAMEPGSEICIGSARAGQPFVEEQ